MGLLQLISPVNSSLIRGSHTNTELDGINDKAAQNSAIWQQCVPYTGLLTHTQRKPAIPPPPPRAGRGGGGIVRIRGTVQQIKLLDVAHVHL